MTLRNTRSPRRKIACNECGVKKYLYQFPEEEIMGRFPTCKRCLGMNAGTTPMLKELEVEVKWRVCLRCDKKFISVNWYRLCDSCKRINGTYYDK